MTLEKLIRKLSRYCPLSLQEKWDFSGYQCGKKHKDKEIQKILLCLDFTEEVYESIRDKNYDLILTHHPFIFGMRTEVFADDTKKEGLFNSVNERLKTPIYSYHTCFDKAPQGMNFTLLKLLNADRITSIADSYLWTGEFPAPLSFENLIRKIKETFNFSYLLGIKSDDKLIKKIGIVGGAGSSDFMTAYKERVDCFISSDCPHHSRLDMRRYKMNYIEVPHEIEEKGFLIGMTSILTKIDSSLEIEQFSFEKPFELW